MARFANVSSQVRELLFGTAAGVLGKGFSTLMVFVFNVVIARLLGVEQTGLFILGLSLVYVFSVISRVGLDNAIVRHVGISTAEEDWPLTRLYYWISVLVTLITSGVFSVAIYSGREFIALRLFDNPELAPVLGGFAFGILPFTLTILHSSFLHARKWIGSAIFFQNAMVLSACLAAVVWLGLSDIPGIVRAFCIAGAFSVLVGVAVWRRALGQSLTGKLASADNARRLFASAWPLYPAALVDRVVMPWAALLVLGFLSTDSEVGIFGMAFRLAMLIIFLVLPLNSFVAPKFAALHASGNDDQVIRLARGVAALGIVFSLPLFIAVLLFSDQFMRVFGEGFAAGGPVLLVLAVGQLTNVITGPVAYLLIMHGYESTYRNCTFAAGVVNIGLAVLLVPKHGALGAAVATALSVLSVNVLSSLMVRYHLGFFVYPDVASLRRIRQFVARGT